MKTFVKVLVVAVLGSISMVAGANPILGEKDGAIELLEDSNRVLFSFLGISAATDYNDNATVELNVDNEWAMQEGSWTDVGSIIEPNPESGSNTYTRFARVWVCPEAGNYHFQIVYRYVHLGTGETNEQQLAESEITCPGAGDPENTSLDGIVFPEPVDTETEDVTPVDTDTADTDSADTSSSPGEDDLTEKSPVESCTVALPGKSSPFILANILQILLTIF